jgi:hypothetical protein
MSRRRGERQRNYANNDDETLVKACESVTVDAVAKNDQTAANSWRRIKYSYHHFWRHHKHSGHSIGVGFDA